MFRILALMFCFFVFSFGGVLDPVIVNPATQEGLNEIANQLDGDLSVFKRIKKAAVVEFTVCYQNSYQDDRTDEMTYSYEDPALYQAASNVLYNTFIEKLKTAGIEIIAPDKLVADENFNKLAGNESETLVWYSRQNKMDVKFLMMPAGGFKATGGGVGAFGMGEVGNAMAQRGNQDIYNEINKSLGTDAVITVHLMLGFDRYFKLGISANRNNTPNDAIKVDLFDIYTKDNNTYKINLKRSFSTAETSNVKNEEVNMEQYANQMNQLFGNLMDAIIIRIK
ncbi:MAG: hypothetical protein PHV30_02840 [Candidatus Margulisbacteria bacterium]|nr:hypothetical protein [Candidatus Margulisiibacteriota bacterium]